MAVLFCFFLFCIQAAQGRRYLEGRLSLSTQMAGTARRPTRRTEKDEKEGWETKKQKKQSRRSMLKPMLRERFDRKQKPPPQDRCKGKRERRGEKGRLQRKKNQDKTKRFLGMPKGTAVWEGLAGRGPKVMYKYLLLFRGGRRAKNNRHLVVEGAGAVKGGAERQALQVFTCTPLSAFSPWQLELL